MVKRVLLIGTFLFLCLSTVGCGSNGDKSPDKSLVFEQVNQGITAQLTVSKNPVPVMQETLLTLTLHDAEGQPVRAASVHYDLSMPGMTMPPNKPDASEQDNGAYTAQAIFTMTGDWLCRAEVEMPDGVLLEFTFDLQAK